MQEFNTLFKVGADPSKKNKEQLLKRERTEVLMKILNYTYSPYLTYRVQQIDFPDKFSEAQGDISAELFGLLDLMASHRVTPAESRGMIKRLMSKCTEEGAVWVSKIIRKDLKIGISASTINKAFPGLVPVFDVMLAQPMIEPKSGDTNWHRVSYPCAGEIKFDGTRIIVVCHGETVQYFSRDGLEQFTLAHLTPYILKIRPGTKFILDGEGIGLKYNDRCAVAKKNYDKGLNWKFAQARSLISSGLEKYTEQERRDGLGLVVWDIIDYDYFMSQGAAGVCKPMRHRRTELVGLFESGAINFPGLQLAESRILRSQADAIAMFKEAVAAGEEGIMLKDLDAVYEFKRSFFMFKVKEFYTADMRILDCIEGTKGTKYEGSLGTILVSDGVITGRVMGGWDDDLGLDMWFRHKRGLMVGTIIEIIYKEITADNNMRHCVFMRERPDKDTTSLG